MKQGGNVLMLDGVVREMSAVEISSTLKHQKSFGKPRRSIARKAADLRDGMEIDEAASVRFRDGVWLVKIENFGTSPFVMFAAGDKVIGEAYSALSVSEFEGELHGDTIWWEFGADSKVRYEGTVKEDGSMVGLQHKKEPAANEAARPWSAKHMGD